MEKSARYNWFTVGDINGFFGIIFDAMAVLAFLSGILIVTFDFPAEIVYKHMIPGSVAAVLFGDLFYTWLAFRLARRTGNAETTAMPQGLDAPSTIGLPLAVYGPAFLMLKGKGYSPEAAAMLTWQLGMACMILIGAIKFLLAFCGRFVQRIVPAAGLLGSLAGIGLALIGFGPLVDIFSAPVVGMISLGLVFYVLIARIDLPGRIPGVLLAMAAGTAIYHGMGELGISVGQYAPPHLVLHPGIPVPSLGFLEGLPLALSYLPIVVPFALLVVVGGINVTASAQISGDDYNTRSILLVDACSTLISGLCGGVAQTTPYVGQPAYHRMGARAGYTLLTGLFLGLGGMLGLVGFIIALVPKAVLGPILLFVALEIVAQAFHATPRKHAAAVALAIFPSVARMLAIQFGNTALVPTANFQRLLTTMGDTLPPLLVEVSLGNGFIITGMLWGAFLCEMIDRRLKACAAYLGILAVFSLFGIVHSADPNGSMYLPWRLLDPARELAYLFTVGYAVLGTMMLLLSFSKGARHHDPDPQGKDLP